MRIEVLALAVLAGCAAPSIPEDELVPDPGDTNRDPGFGEIQAMRDRGLTTGCATLPARFCPDALLGRRDAATLLTRAFELEDGEADAQVGCSPCSADPISETELAAAITALGGTPPAASAIPRPVRAPRC